MNSLPKTVIRQRHGCDLNPCPFAPESSMLTTRLPIDYLCLPIPRLVILIDLNNQSVTCHVGQIVPKWSVPKSLMTEKYFNALHS